MAFRSKRKSQSAYLPPPSDGAAPEGSSGTVAPGETMEFPVFDGQGNRSIIVVKADRDGRMRYRLRSKRGFKSHLSHLDH
jgi:hypothetical protein